MTRRLAITLLTVLALLWQGASSSAMAAAMALPAVEAEAEVRMPCHEMAGIDDPAASTDAAGDAAAMADCCGSGGQCLCTAACGAAALPGTALLLNLLPAPDVKAGAISTAPRATAPPHPFRPPIGSAV